MIGLRLAESGRLPDWVFRRGIRRMVRERLGEEDVTDAFLARLRSAPVALVPDKANEQHYEVDPGFFQLVLGPRLKYSCSLFERSDTSLAEAEDAMLGLTCEHADLRDRMRVLELGCGWGSLTLWMAERYPGAHITAVSNSKAQRELILSRCANLGLSNVEVSTCDVNVFRPDVRFDRIVSVEMFEHMRNWHELLRRVSTWLDRDGKAFCHVFCHRERAYPFEDRGDGDWMARHFFSGGLMPSSDMFERCADNLRVASRWLLPGTHYARTADAWLANLDERRETVRAPLARTYGPEAVDLWRQRWRLFFLAVSELFGHRGGREWGVTHVLLEPVP
jgi:cyclopropane-fatty-acyl-phospholipid synthase